MFRGQKLTDVIFSRLELLQKKGYVTPLNKILLLFIISLSKKNKKIKK